MLTVLLGGARSGKSTLAVTLARSDLRAVTYVATAPDIPGDDEMANRIARHREERPGDWVTVEEQTDLAGALEGVDTPVVIVDCITVWLGNVMHHGHDAQRVVAATDEAIAAVRQRDLDAIVISNEVGLGIVPVNDMAREYRDLLGVVNQRWVAAADRALLMVAGRALALHDPGELLS